jgi:predicted CxxxxCH...CXXCH cytochrome family protein
MKKSTVLMISILIVLCGLFASGQIAWALDAPHNTNDQGWSINCSSCHYSPTSTPSWATLPATPENTFFNNLCTDCHTAGRLSSSQYTDIKTHSAANTGSAYWSGQWTVECRTCHSPHYQQQATNTAYVSQPGVNVVTGAVTGLNSSPAAVISTLTDASKNFITNQYADYLLLPNVNYPARVYRIISNTQTTFTVAGAINLNYTGVGTTYAIRYGKMVNAAISYPGGANYGYTNPPVSAPVVKFFNVSGENSYGTSTTASNMTAVCQVCHTQTQSFNNSGVQESGNHPANVAGKQNCMECHTHASGFKIGGCIGCHGTPPIDNTLGGPTGLANNNGGTGSTTPGAHAKHSVSLNYSCDACHEKGMPVTAMPNYSIEMGFKATYNPNGGTYWTRTSLANGYTYTQGNVLTTLTPSATGPMSCSNLYCHSNVQPPTTGSGLPTSFATASWAGAVACGDCHAADGVQGKKTLMSSGSHSTHVNTTTGGYSLACGTCHLNAGSGTLNHVDRVIEVNFNTPLAGTGSYGGDAGNTGNHAPGQGYGSCSTTYCHGNFAGGNNANTPAWGNAASGNCGTCHGASAANPPVNASHSKHAGASGYSYGCQLCHSSTTADGTSITNYTNHVDHNTDWSFSAADQRTNGALYKGATTGNNTTVGTGYGSCTNLYCHSQGTSNTAPYSAPIATATWGAASLGCAGCHGGVGTLATGAHAKHLATAIPSGAITCNNCHNATAANSTTISNAANHVDKSVTINFNGVSSGATATYNGQTVGGASVYQKTPGSAVGTCNTTNCHGGNSQAWNIVNNDATCVKCHGVAGTSPAAYGADRNLAAPGYNNTGVNTSGNVGTITGGVSNDIKVGAHDTHLRGNGGFKSGGIACTDCHSVSSLSDSGHMNGATSFSWSALATKGGALTPTYSAGTCNNVYCHGAAMSVVATQGTNTRPGWTLNSYLTQSASAMNTADCNICHQSPAFSNPNYNHSGVTLTAGACNSCHGHDGASAMHIDGVLQATGGACNSCHDYDLDANGDWGKNQKAIEGWGAHALHISHLKNLSGVTLNAAGDFFGSASFNAVCGVCHTRSSSNHAMSGTPNTRTINFGDGQTTYMFSTASGTITYNGVTGVSSATTPKTCSNVSCHFQPAPVWQGI